MHKRRRVFEFVVLPLFEFQFGFQFGFLFSFVFVRYSIVICIGRAESSTGGAAGRLIIVLQRVKRPKLNSFVFSYLSETYPPSSICQPFCSQLFI